MRFKRKDGKCSIVVFGLSNPMIIALMVAQEVYDEFENIDNFVITSARDGKHKRGSEHYKGDAIDLRVWGFTPEQRAEVAKTIAERLTDEFEVFDEGDHIHIGFDPQDIQ